MSLCLWPSRTGVLWPSSGDLSESELLVRSLRGLDSCLSFMGVLLRFCRGVCPPSSLMGTENAHRGLDTWETLNLNCGPLLHEIPSLSCLFKIKAK